MPYEDFEREDESNIMDEFQEPWEKPRSNIVHTMSAEEYRKYCEHYKRMEKRTCRRCGKEMTLRKGPYGEFFGCSGYPECTYKERLLN